MFLSDCDLAYLSYERIILMEEINSSIAFFSIGSLSDLSLELAFVSFVDSFLYEKSHWCFTGLQATDTDWGALYHAMR